MEAIKEMLGLAPDATEEQVAEAIQALKGQVETYTAEKAEAETKAKAEAFSQKYGDRFVDEDAAAAFYRANPEHAEKLAESVKVVEKVVTKEVPAPVAHRAAGTPAKAEDKTPLGIYRKHKAMDDGPEKDAFFRANVQAINEGATLAEQEAGE